MKSHRLILLCLLSLWAAIAPAAENPRQGKPIGELRQVLTGKATELERLNAAKAIDAMIPAKPQRDPRAQQQQQQPQQPAADAVAGDIVDALLPGLEDPAGSVRYVCRQALGRGGATALPGLLAALKSGNPDARSYATDALADMAQFADAPSVPLEQAVPGLSQALKDGHYAVRVSACLALKQLGPRSAAALPGLVAALEDREWAVAEAAVQAVAAVDPAGTTAVPALVKVLEHSPHELREIVCQELGTLGPKAKAAVPALIKLLDADKSDWFAGKAAATTLMKIAAYDARTTPEDPAADVRPQIIAAIAKSAATQQTPFVKTERLTALFVPRHLTCPLGKEALPALPYALETLKAWMHQPPNPWVPRQGLVDFLAAVGPHAKPEVLAVVTSLAADKTVDQTQGVKQLENLLKQLQGDGA
jgi:HEAT repeat protein